MVAHDDLPLRFRHIVLRERPRRPRFQRRLAPTVREGDDPSCLDGARPALEALDRPPQLLVGQETSAERRSAIASASGPSMDRAQSMTVLTALVTSTRPMATISASSRGATRMT